MTAEQARLCAELKSTIRYMRKCDETLDDIFQNLLAAFEKTREAMEAGVDKVDQFSLPSGTSAGRPGPLEGERGPRTQEMDRLLRRQDAEAGAMVSLKPFSSGGGMAVFNGTVAIELSPLKYDLLAILKGRGPRRPVASVGGGWLLVSEVRRALGTPAKPLSATHFRNVVCRLRRTLRVHGVNPALLQTRRAGRGKTQVRLLAVSDPRDVETRTHGQ